MPIPLDPTGYRPVPVLDTPEDSTCAVEPTGFCTTHLGQHLPEPPAIRPYVLPEYRVLGPGADEPSLHVSVSVVEYTWLQDTLREAIRAAEHRVSLGQVESPTPEAISALFYRWAEQVLDQAPALGQERPAGG